MEHALQHLQAMHSLGGCSHPSQHDSWAFWFSPVISKVWSTWRLKHKFSGVFTIPAIAFSVVFNEALKLSNNIRLNPFRQSLAQRPASCQYEITDFGQPTWVTTSISGISIPMPKATVANKHRIVLFCDENSRRILALELSWVHLWNISTNRFSGETTRPA